MAMSRSVLILACAATVLPLALGGCAGALVVGGLAAAGGAGYAAGQERGVNGVTTDIALKTNIEMALLKADPQLQKDITTNVYAGRVLLTGRVPSPAMKMTANQLAGAQQGVRAIYDEVQVAPPGSVWDDTQDTWITGEVRSKMVLDPAIRSVNYTVETENGAVYLIGSARSQAELDRATQIARYVPGVRRVVSYVELRTGAPMAAIPASAAVGSPQPPPPAADPGQYVPGGAAAPQARIEVQKL